MSKRMTYGEAVMVDVAVGLIAGLAAAAAMQAFQTTVKTQIDDLEPAEPATAKAADAVSQTVAAQPVPEKYKTAASTAVHYGTGALIGAAYGLISGIAPIVTLGRGLLFGAAVWGLGDELAAPALGLARRASDTAPEKHAYRAASHAVFAITMDTIRRKLNEWISRE